LQIPAVVASRAGLPAVLLVLAGTLIAWGGVPWGTFQFDDFLNVVRDPATLDPAAFAERLPQGLRPLTRLSYFVDGQLHGLNAAGFLATNLLLHLFTVLLVLALARRRLSEIGACAAALIFAVQPAHAEVVAYVSGRSTGLMTPLLLGGLLLHDHGRTAGALVLFALACLAKEVALVFPALLLVWELTRAVPRPRFRRELAIAAAVAVVTAALLFSLVNYQAMLGYSSGLRPVSENLLASARAIPEMLSLWIRPWALSADHAFDAAGHVGAAVAGLLLLAGLVTIALALRRRIPLLAFAILWPLVALLPTNSLVAKIDLVTEKPLYLAWLGPALALGAAVSASLAAASSRAARRCAAGVVVAVLCVLAAATQWRASLWRDPVRLWLDATAKAPECSRCWNNLGMARLVAKQDVEAVAAFERALRLDPANETARLNLHTALALCGRACSED
jgi:hypothetical protein